MPFFALFIILGYLSTIVYRIVFGTLFYNGI